MGCELLFVHCLCNLAAIVFGGVVKHSQNLGLNVSTVPRKVREHLRVAEVNFGPIQHVGPQILEISCHGHVVARWFLHGLYTVLCVGFKEDV